MKFAFLAGGFLGFALVALAGFTAGRSADLVLRDAALACLVGALVLRWFWSVVIRAFADAMEQRRRDAAAAHEAQAAARAVPVGPAGSSSVPTRVR
jgi:divalent metal cation (Fe/Co/Zn/Cd) transporter